jgi:hypothetical protein
MHNRRRGHRKNKVLGVGNVLSRADERNQRAGMVSENERKAKGFEKGIRQS